MASTPTTHAVTALGCLATNAAELATTRPMTVVAAKILPGTLPSVVALTLRLFAAGMGVPAGGITERV